MNGHTAAGDEGNAATPGLNRLDERSARVPNMLDIVKYHYSTTLSQVVEHVLRPLLAA
jgi:hypothetical protein